MYDIDEEDGFILPRVREQWEEDQIAAEALVRRDEAQAEIRALNAAGQVFSWGGYEYPFLIPEKNEREHPTCNSARVVQTDIYSNEVICLDCMMVLKAITGKDELSPEDLAFCQAVGQFIYRFADDPLGEAWRPEYEFKKRFQKRFNRPWKYNR